MMNRQEKALVAEIKTLYGQRHEEKLQIQRDMAELIAMSWTQEQIAEATGIPQSTVSNWLRAYDEESATNLGEPSRLTPRSEQARSDRAVAKRVLKEAPLEQVEQIIAELPQERREAVEAAVGNRYAQARRDMVDDLQRRSPQERADVEQGKRAVGQMTARATAGFASMTIVDHLEQATEMLNRLAGEAALSPDQLRAIDDALTSFDEALTFARQLVGEERA